jgi:hypothetical protein
MTRLLKMGAIPTAISLPSRFLVPEELEFKELTLRIIAEHCGHLEAFESGTNAAGLMFEETEIQCQGQQVLGNYRDELTHQLPSCKV